MTSRQTHSTSRTRTTVKARAGAQHQKHSGHPPGAKGTHVPYGRPDSGALRAFA